MEFKYQLREPHNIALVTGKDNITNTLASCLFGSFPCEKHFSYYENTFKNVFGSKTINIDAANLEKIYSEEVIYPLKVANKFIDAVSANHQDPSLYIFDLTKSHDLIDFWNLRAVYDDKIIPIPKQWLAELSAFCKKFILHNYRPLPGNSFGVMIQPVAMFSRSIADDEIKLLFKQYIEVEKHEANLVQTYYPYLHTASCGVADSRPKLTVEEKEVEYSFNEKDKLIKLNIITPCFYDKYDGSNKWANVIKLQNMLTDDSVNTVFPIDFRNPKFPKAYLGDTHILPTSEGLVFLSGTSTISEYFEVNSCSEAISLWFKSQGISTVQSDAGRSTQQIIDTLGGFFGVRVIANRKVIEVLNNMAMKPVSKTEKIVAFKNKLDKAVDGDRWRHSGFDKLVNNGAVELGAEIKCTECGHPSWFEIPKLDHKLKCDLCRRVFDFPKVDPKTHLDWLYRVVGPFALPNYGKGGYSAALTIRFFANIVGEYSFSDISWSAGRELTYKDGKKIEADFILWLQQRSIIGNDSHERLVFGEAKSFAKEAIKDADILAMKEFAKRHTGTILVFSVLKMSLSRTEKSRLAKLALWGRGIDKKTKKEKARVIVLTGCELFSINLPDFIHSWKNGTDKQREISDIYKHDMKNVDILASITQQVYLGLPSY
ncbi:hypothetical protein [Aliivibrio sifiae]|uniref:hypothetical protein n=1 Tax=Aliivibrio sifiae TaxID=566293 RepID=UPI003D0BB190